MTSPASAVEANAELDQICATLRDAATGPNHLSSNASNKLLRDAASFIEAVARQAEALQRENAELRGALMPFSKIPTHGTFGGPLCGMKAVYEDGSDSKNPPGHSVLGHEPIRRARALLGGSDEGN